MKREDHWDSVYRTRAEDSLSWFQDSPRPSLDSLAGLGLAGRWSLIDVGGGASRLVDALAEAGVADITVLDISSAALETTQRRLGPLANAVRWEAADITRWHPSRTYDVWHDRAVFHFLTAAEEREAYVKAVLQGTAAGSFVLIATFAPDGPATCSGLPVQRYDAPALEATLGSSFELLRDWREEHVTPAGNRQSFTWCIFRRRREALPHDRSS